MIDLCPMHLDELDIIRHSSGSARYQTKEGFYHGTYTL